MDQITIVDAYRVRQITGKLVKQYPLGITIDDARDIRHYATFDRVMTPLAPPQETTATPGNNSPLF